MQPELTLNGDRHSIKFMKRVSVFLVLLLVVLTFNAYACILPLQQSGGMDCPSEAEQPIRGACDAFIEIGPSTQVSSSAMPTIFQLECAVPVLLNPHTVVPPLQVAESPHHRLISPSIPPSAPRSLGFNTLSVSVLLTTPNHYRTVSMALMLRFGRS